MTKTYTHHIGEVVMVTKNVPKSKIYNGLVGTIVQLYKDAVEIVDDEGKTYLVGYITQQKTKGFLI